MRQLVLRHGSDIVLSKNSQADPAPPPTKVRPEETKRDSMTPQQLSAEDSAELLELLYCRVLEEQLDQELVAELVAAVKMFRTLRDRFAVSCMD